MHLATTFFRIILAPAFVNLVNSIKCSLHAVATPVCLTVHLAIVLQLVINAKMDLIMIWKNINVIGSARIKKELIGIIKL